MDASSELAMRRLTAMARHGDPDGSLAEHVIGFTASLLARRLPERTGSGRPATAAARRRAVSQAKAALAADPRLGLVALSRAAGCSPYHLSRVFTQLTGLTVSQYRNRLRVSQLSRLPAAARRRRQDRISADGSLGLPGPAGWRGAPDLPLALTLTTASATTTATAITTYTGDDTVSTSCGTKIVCELVSCPASGAQTLRAAASRDGVHD
jgi:AraC-like DNA-binding protein